MELVIKTKGDAFGEMKVYNYSEEDQEYFDFKFKKFILPNEVGCRDNYYQLELTKHYYVYNSKSHEWEEQSYAHTFDITKAQCDTNEQYQIWLNKNIEFILINGTFFFQNEEQNQINFEESPF
jgi:hypothetical protein